MVSYVSCYKNSFILSFDGAFSSGRCHEGPLQEKSALVQKSSQVKVKDSSKYAATVIAMGQQMSVYKTKTSVIAVMAAFLPSLLGCNLTQPLYHALDL